MNILEEAEETIYGDREKTYGHPARNLNTIAGLWTVYLVNKEIGGDDPTIITANDVCMMMILLKVSRQANFYKRDNLVDIAGYAALADRLENEEKPKCISPQKGKK
jgi:hypothetical protein